MKLCAIQIPYVKRSGDVAKSVDMAIAELDKCDDSCDIILTPEYTNAPGGFNVGECIPFAQKQTPRLIAAARNAAIRCNAIVAVNYVCEAEKGLFRNTTEVFDRHGNSAGRFFKQHLPRAEKNVNLLDEEYTRKFRAPEIVEVDGIRFGFLICYDTYFSEYIAHLAHVHPDVILVSSFQRAERKNILRMMNVHLAFNCNAYVLRASVAMGKESPEGGNSMVVSPEGEILCEFGDQLGRMDCVVDDVKYKYMRSNSYGGTLIPNDQFVEQARATWAYRPCGSMTVEGDRKMDYPRLGAHRGLSRALPENSLASFGAAVALGAQEIALDVRFSKDGVPVVAHSSYLEYWQCSEGKIEEHSFAELREMDFGSYFSKEFAGLKIASLEEVFSKFARHAVFNLQIKDQPGGSEQYYKVCMEEIVRLIYLYDQQEHVYITGSPAVVSSAAAVAPELPRCINEAPNGCDLVEEALKYQCAKVQFNAADFNIELLRKAQQNDLRCVVKCCDDPEQIREYFSCGVDTVLTNNFLAAAQNIDLK